MLRELAHLHEQLGEKRFEVLIASGNTRKVKELCDQILRNTLPTIMTVGERTYEILDLVRDGERSVIGDAIVERAKEMSAYLGEDDGLYILKHQQDIPVVLKRRVFIFPGWRCPSSPKKIACIYRPIDEWIRYWSWIDEEGLLNPNKLLRRK